MGRKKIEIKYIKSKRDRFKKFPQRRTGLLKKISEFGILFGVQISVTFTDLANNLNVYSNFSQMKNNYSDQFLKEFGEKTLFNFDIEDYPFPNGAKKSSLKISSLDLKPRMDEELKKREQSELFTHLTDTTGSYLPHITVKKKMSKPRDNFASPSSETNSQNDSFRISRGRGRSQLSRMSVEEEVKSNRSEKRFPSFSGGYWDNSIRLPDSQAGSESWWSTSNRLSQRPQKVMGARIERKLSMFMMKKNELEQKDQMTFSAPLRLIELCFKYYYSQEKTAMSTALQKIPRGEIHKLMGILDTEPFGMDIDDIGGLLTLDNTSNYSGGLNYSFNSFQSLEPSSPKSVRSNKSEGKETTGEDKTPQFMMYLKSLDNPVTEGECFLKYKDCDTKKKHCSLANKLECVGQIIIDICAGLISPNNYFEFDKEVEKIIWPKKFYEFKNKAVKMMLEYKFKELLAEGALTELEQKDDFSSLTLVEKAKILMKFKESEFKEKFKICNDCYECNLKSISNTQAQAQLF